MALLTVEDDAFWEGSEPVQFGSLPQLQDAVAVVGYPIGGDTMSVTSGVVSRIEVTSYVHGSSELLGIQIDAAINSGNSGGPAFNEEVSLDVSCILVRRCGLLKPFLYLSPFELWSPSFIPRASALA